MTTPQVSQADRERAAEIVNRFMYQGRTEGGYRPKSLSNEIASALAQAREEGRAEGTKNIFNQPYHDVDKYYKDDTND